VLDKQIEANVWTYSWTNEMKEVKKERTTASPDKYPRKPEQSTRYLKVQRMKRKIHTAYVRTSQELEVPSEATA
jgi:hypothetical protein